MAIQNKSSALISSHGMAWLGRWCHQIYYAHSNVGKEFLSLSSPFKAITHVRDLSRASLSSKVKGQKAEEVEWESAK